LRICASSCFSINICPTLPCEGCAPEELQMAQSPDLFQLHGRVQLQGFA